MYRIPLDIVRDITEAAKNYNSNDAANWYERVRINLILLSSSYFIYKLSLKAMQYNVPKGKTNRGILTVSTYKSLVNSKDISAENLKLAEILGWCVELVRGIIKMFAISLLLKELFA